LVFTSTLFPHQASKLFQRDARHTRPVQAQQTNLRVVCEPLLNSVVTVVTNMPRGGVGCKDISPKEVEDAFKLTAPGFVLTPEAASNQDIIYQGSKGGAQGTLDKYNTYIPCAPTTTTMHCVNITLNMLREPWAANWARFACSLTLHL